MIELISFESNLSSLRFPGIQPAIQWHVRLNRLWYNRDTDTGDKMKGDILKVTIAAICSFIIPGLGQLFYGKLLWALVWLGLGIMSCGVANVLAALHVVFIGVK